MSEKNYLSTNEIVIISLISALGGILSSFVSIIGKQTFVITGVSGIGQIVSGVHVFWLALLVLLIQKPGVATYAGLIKGIVEVFTGNPNGAITVLISLTQGLCIDFVFLIAQLLKLKKENLFILSIATIISSPSNILFTKILFYEGVPLTQPFLTFLIIMAGLSGMVFGGFFAYDTYQIIKETMIIESEKIEEVNYLIEKSKFLKLRSIWKSTSNSIIGLIIIFVFIIGSTYISLISS